MSELILRCQQLHKRFNEGGLSVNVLQGIDLEIRTGEQVAIVGSSGSGKSTLLHLLGGLDDPNEGEIWIMGHSLNQLNAAERGRWRNQHLGFIYQFHHLLPEFTALENVSMPLLIRGIPTGQAKERSEDILDKVGLAKRLHHKPGELSGGERQRAAVARALVTQPRCVLADEPTGNLDPRTAEQVYERMLELNQSIGTSLVVVTHAPALASRMDRIFRLDEGRLVLEK